MAGKSGGKMDDGPFSPPSQATFTTSSEDGDAFFDRTFAAAYDVEELFAGCGGQPHESSAACGLPSEGGAGEGSLGAPNDDDGFVVGVSAGDLWGLGLSSQESSSDNDKQAQCFEPTTQVDPPPVVVSSAAVVPPGPARPPLPGAAALDDGGWALSQSSQESEGCGDACAASPGGQGQGGGRCSSLARSRSPRRSQRSRSRSSCGSRSSSATPEAARRPKVGPLATQVKEPPRIVGCEHWQVPLWNASVSQRMSLPQHPSRPMRIECLCAGTGAELLGCEVLAW